MIALEHAFWLCGLFIVGRAIPGLAIELVRRAASLRNRLVSTREASSDASATT